MAIASSGALERARQTHEEVESYTSLAATALSARHGGSTEVFGSVAPKTPLEASQLARECIDAARLRCENLVKIYQDDDGSLADCLFSIRTSGKSSNLRSFYEQLREVRAQHRSASDGIQATNNNANETLLNLLPSKHKWTPEEVRGTCLDLHEHHSAFINIIKSKDIDYVTYVRGTMVEFTAVNPKSRRSRAYLEYIQGILAYLSNFAKCAYPLDELEKLIDGERNRLLEEQVKNCERLITRFGSDAESLLEGLGAVEISTQLKSLGLKAGGRPSDRAKRLVDYALANKPVELVVDEGIVRYLAIEILAEERVATAQNAEKKLALSYAELEAERKAQESSIAFASLKDEDDEGQGDEEAPVYNPKDVPLGWDGKPIPYWLYKLHGLNHEFKCEICGDAVYRGPRAFERHFSAARHVQGLRCLGIRYSKEFVMITRIADATALHRRLTRQTSEKAAVDGDVEFEDSDGNVLNRKTYEDLARQGLL